MLIGWTMGGYPSPNFQLAQRLSRTPAPDVDAVLDALARERFGPEGAPHARKAWTLMSDAFRQYPFHISVVYTSPVQCGPANPLYPAKTGYPATMWGIPYDDLDGWRGPYPPEVFAAQFEKMAEGWRAGHCRAAGGRGKDAARSAQRGASGPALRPGGGHPFPVGRQPGAFCPRPRRAGQARRARCRPRSAHRLQAEIKRLPGVRDRLGPPALHARRGRIRGSASNPRASTSTCRWTWWRKWSIAAGCWGTSKSFAWLEPAMTLLLDRGEIEDLFWWKGPLRCVARCGVFSRRW